MQKVKSWMMDLVVDIDPEATVSEALALMRRRYIHSLITKKTKKYPQIGIVTSTDICDKIIAVDRNPSEVRVYEIMTSPIITVKADQDLKTCALMMKERHIHHLPVVNDDGMVIAMISATDFMVAAEALGAPGERKLS
jgi:signal-transduction protein with cAMP-binding, CBS, and nucleotidyltransferase domain